MVVAEVTDLSERILKSKVDSWLAPHPHLHYVTHNQKSVELLCDNHGCFSMKVSSFSGNSEKKFLL